ncbi:MAG: 3-alpha-(or 20-beta)-hydroxysteroid dehydrogenase [Gammaproteobacteria bacterium]|jgi:3alpha(or 20beta)-hydroxysteroid dehydrogenase|nr:3-alpha-(or 20-beta)-hydroxysteroid dehydrogenase [Gammaproteobacteria bacterium]
MNRLANKVAVITGAAQGMGAAHARRFVAEGAKVILTDINAEMGGALLRELGPNALFVAHDVTEPASWAEVIRQGEAKFGKINVLVNNAGIIGDIANTRSITDANYMKVIAVNQHGVFYGMQAVIPSMLQAGGGSIVNISSIAGIVACHGAPNVAYVASKFAVRGMTKFVATEYGRYNIRVNSVHPGFIKTPMMVAATDAVGAGATAMIPLARMADPDEVSQLVVFLASDESSFITAEEHVIDGGMTAQ